MAASRVLEVLTSIPEIILSCFISEKILSVTYRYIRMFLAGLATFQAGLRRSQLCLQTFQGGLQMF